MGYLEDKFFCFTKFSNSNIKESNRIEEIDKNTIILNNDNKYLSNLPHSKTKQAKKNRKKAQKHQLK